MSRSRTVIVPRRSMLRSVVTWVRRGLLGLLGLQFAIASTLTGVDAVRKWRRPQGASVPRRDPGQVQAADTETVTFTYGEDLYEAMLTAIRSATDRILFESFIWKGDRVGTDFLDALNEAARRGVDVYVIYDGFANLVVPRRFYRFDRRVHVRRFPVLRTGAFLLDVRKTGRDHRKILVVDDTTAFVGGYNVGTVYATQWRDTHLQLTGPAVWELANAFIDLWNMTRGRDLPELEDRGTEIWEPRLRAHRNVPGQLVYPIRGMYLEAIDRAVDHIWITQAYFIPDRDILSALLRACARGVDVRVIVPEVSNHVLADWLSRGFYSKLLDGGVTILLYQSMVHAKTATIDGRWSTVGTANIDRLSLTGNYEINLEIVDEAFASELEDVFRHDMHHCRELTEIEWRHRPAVARFSEAMLAPLRPLL